MPASYAPLSRRAILPLLATAPFLRAAAPAERIRIAQIGTRHAHAAGKLDALRQQPETYELLGLADMEPSQAASYAELKRYAVDELLALPQLQAVTVETALPESLPMAWKAVRAGKHIHLDKPGATDTADFRAMRQEAEQRGLVVQMGYMFRHNPVFQLILQACTSGWLGEVTEIDAMMGKQANAGLRKELAALPGGGMFELGCHMLDAAMTLLGKPKEVHAISTPTQEDGAKDNQLAILVYPRATVTLRCNHADPFGGPRRRFQVTGTRGSIEAMPMESGQLTLRLSEAQGSYKKGEQKLTLPVPKGRYEEEFRAFAKAIRKESPLRWDAAHDVAVHETLLRASGLA